MIKAFPRKVNLSSSNKGLSKNTLYLKNKSKVLFPVFNRKQINKNFLLRKSKFKDFSWRDEKIHKGKSLYKINKYRILDCVNCGFIHCCSYT